MRGPEYRRPDPQPPLDPPEVRERDERDEDWEYDAARDREDEREWVRTHKAKED